MSWRTGHLSVLTGASCDSLSDSWCLNQAIELGSPILSENMLLVICVRPHIHTDNTKTVLCIH